MKVDRATSFAAGAAQPVVPVVPASPASPALRQVDVALSWVVPVLLIAAGLLEGGNRPALWLLGSTLFCALLTVRFAVLAFAGAGGQIGRAGGAPRLLSLLGAVFLVGLGAQLLPLPAALAPLAASPLAAMPSGEPVSLAPSATALGILRGFGALALFLLILGIGAWRDLRHRLAWLIVVGVAAHGLWGMAALGLPGEGALWAEKAAYQGFVTGGFVNRNAFAACLGMGFNLALAMGLGAWRARPAEAVLLFALALVIMLALAGTGSRMGLVSTLAGAAVVLGLFLRGSRRARRRGPGVARAILPGVGALALLALLAGEPLLERFLAAPAALGDRLLLWRQTLAMIAERPWTGHGWDAFAPAFELHHRLPLTPARMWDFPHSTYLTLWAEAGLFWGSLPLVAGVLLAARLLAQVRASRTPAGAEVAGPAILLQAALHAGLDFSFEIYANLLLFLAVLGLAAAGSAGRSSAERTARNIPDG